MKRQQAMWFAGLMGIVLSTNCGAAQDSGQPAEQEEKAVPLQPAPDEKPPPESPMGDWTVTVRGGGRIEFRADVDGTPGDIEVYRVGGGVEVAGPLGDRARLTLDLDEEASWYLFENATGLAPGSDDPFENVYRTRFSPRVFVVHDQEWAWFVGGLFHISGEGGADVGDAFTYGGFAGMRWTANENFAISLGLGAKTRFIEDEILAIPLIALEWRITDTLTLTSDGLGGRLAAKLSDEVTVALRGEWELRDYKLDDEGALPDGAVSDERILVGMEVAWRVTQRTTLSVGGGAVVWQEFNFEDAGENTVSETNTDPTAYLGLEFRVSF